MNDLAFPIYFLISAVAGVVGGLLYGWPVGRLLFVFWPYRVVQLWLERQTAVWAAPPVRVQHWLAAERSRRVWRVGRLTLLYRPALTLDVPVLVSPSELVLTPGFCRLRLCWKTRS